MTKPDEQAARLVGKQGDGVCVGASAFIGRQLADNTWLDVWQIANEQPAPPPDVFVRLRDGLRVGPAEKNAPAGWRKPLTKTTNSDTHPCLTERLGALGVDDQRLAALSRSRHRRFALGGGKFARCETRHHPRRCSRALEQGD